MVWLPLAEPKPKPFLSTWLHQFPNAIPKSPEQQNSLIFPSQPRVAYGWNVDQLFYQKVQGGCSSSKVGMLVH